MVRIRDDSAMGSRARMLETTIDLMRAHGLSGTGINDIVRESGAPKGSVYHFFPDGKLQIAGEALSLYTRRVQEFLHRALSNHEQSGAKVEALFEAFAVRVEEGAFLRSCAAGAVSLDLAEGLESVRQLAQAAFAAWTAEIASHFDLGDRTRTHSFAGLLLTAIEGAYVRCRSEQSSQAFRDAGYWLAQLVELPPTKGDRVHDVSHGVRRRKAEAGKRLLPVSSKGR
jgi:AcrR family transcriptional regulator